MGFLNAKMFLTGIAVILFGWWVNTSALPLFFPRLVGTPAGSFYSVIASFVFWIFLFILFWRHDRQVRSEAQ